MMRRLRRASCASSGEIMRSWSCVWMRQYRVSTCASQSLIAKEAVERVVLRKGAWLPRSFTLNALVLRLRDGFAAGYLRLRRLLPSSSEKPIHLWLRLARDTRATTAVAAAVSAAMFKILQATRLPLQSNRRIYFAGSRKTATRIKSRRCYKATGEAGGQLRFPCYVPFKSQPHGATLSTPKAFASHYRLNAINFRSLRRCVKASPAIASAPPIHVLGSGTGAAWITVSTMSLPSGPPV